MAFGAGADEATKFFGAHRRISEFSFEGFISEKSH
jgi:hypothetical protein